MGQTKLNEEQVDLTSYKKAEQTTAEISAAVQTHNTAGDAHADIRTALSGKAEQTALEAHTADTDNPHSVTKAQLGLGNVDNTADAEKPVSSAVQAALARKQDDDEFHPEDYGWPDIRPAARPNAIVLLAGVKADFSDYDNLGFTATCEGGYNVFIDGVQYGDTYASKEQCSITWSQYSATTGFPVTQPEALTAHIVQIVPAIPGEKITAYTPLNLNSDNESQGIIWAYLNIENAIDFRVRNVNKVINPNIVSVSAKNNVLKILSSLNFIFSSSPLLVYIPILNGEGRSIYGGQTFNGSSSIKKVHFQNMKLTNIAYTFYGTNAIENLILENIDTSACKLMSAALPKVNKIPCIDFSSSTDCGYLFGSGNGKMCPFVVDVSYAHNITRLGMPGILELKNLFVSPLAPFNATSPQIDVPNTGLDQNALVALFKSLPYNVGYDVVGNPTIQDGVVSGFTANDLLSVSGKFAYSAITEMVIKFRVNSSFLGTQKYTNILSTPQLVLYGNTSDFSAIFNIPGIGDIGLGKVSPDTDYWVKYLNDGTTVSSWISENGSSWTQKDSKDSTGLSTDIISRTLYFGGRGIGDSGRPAFDGSIDLAKSYIKISGVPWFRGAAAMEKTINITGATGAAALTSEQLAIATDKGWTVTR